MKKKVIHMVEWDGVDLDINEVAAKLDKTYSVIAYYVTKLGLVTKDTLIAKLKDVKENPKPRVTLKTHKFIMGEMSIPAMWKVHPYKTEVSEQMVYNRLRKYGAESPVILYPRCTQKELKELMLKDGLITGLEAKSDGKMPTIKIYLDRSRCMVDGNRCVHYKSCTDKVCFEQKFHSRYKEDHSCYSRSKRHHTNENHGGEIKNYSGRVYGKYSR